jgi:Uncharacterized conserved protein (DUF2304)
MISMSSFVGHIQIVCLATLALLIVYTLWLSRYRGLDGHLTVRWLLIQVAALLTTAFWRWLPFFTVTSVLQERELLLMITVLQFAFVVFLMLDLLVRSSRQSTQIKRLTQEVAIQRTRIDTIAPEPLAPEALQGDRATVVPSHETPDKSSKARILAGLWIIFCVGFSCFEIYNFTGPHFPVALRSFLSANYLE